MSKRILITMLFLVIYWVGRFIPVPGANYGVLKTLVSMSNAGGFEHIMRRVSIFSLDIMPYVSIHIIVLLLTAVPPFRNNFKNGNLGIKKINQFIYGGVILLSLIQAFFLTLWIARLRIPNGAFLVNNPGILFRLTSILSITAGTLGIIWMANQINKYGIGNGISLFFLSGLLIKMRHPIMKMVVELSGLNLLKITLGLLLFIVFVGIIVSMLRKEKKIPVIISEENARELTMSIPFNIGGILPIQFTISILLFPATIIALSGKHVNSVYAVIGNILASGTLGSYLAWIVLIIFFAYFFTAVVFNPVELIPRLKHFGLSIPGRDSEKTAIKYLDGIVTKIIFIWSIFLCIAAFLPVFLHRLLQVHIPFTGYELILFIGIILGICSSLKKQGNFREVFRHPDMKEIVIIKTKLESKGVTARMGDCESYARLLSLSVGPLAKKKILVNELDYDKSISLIKQTSLNR